MSETKNKRYAVYITKTVTERFLVSAKDEEEAAEKALEDYDTDEVDDVDVEEVS